MAFALEVFDGATRDITVTIPTDNQGDVQLHVTYRLSALTAETPDGYIDWIPTILTAWDVVLDGKPVPPTSAGLATLAAAGRSIPTPVYAAIIAAVYEDSRPNDKPRLTSDDR